MKPCNPFRRICCCCPPPASFTVTKQNTLTHDAVAGAVYILYQDGRPIASSASGADGSLSFSDLSPGEYELIETAAPDGFEQDPVLHRVVVGSNGDVVIDGQSPDAIHLYNTPEQRTQFSFFKFDRDSGLPLPGAEFTLSNGATAVSDENGYISFGALLPGAYTMTETNAPDGYSLNPDVFTVTVSADGSIAINGAPLTEFSVANSRLRSERPVIRSVVAGDREITGTGIPGASLTVTLPDGTQLETTVDGSGQWRVDLSDSAELTAGESLYANQTVPGLAPSDNASFLVQA